MTAPSKLAGDLKRLVAAHRPRVHPEADELLEYQRGTLPAARREALQDHLSRCEDCARAVLDLADFPHIRPRPGAVDPVLPDPQQLLADLSALGALPPRPRTGTSAAARWPLYLAAGLGLVCLGLGGYLALLRSQLGTARDALARREAAASLGAERGHSVEILSLQPVGHETVRSGLAAPAVLARGPGSALVVLNTYLQTAGPYTVELVDAQGVVRETWPGVVPIGRKNLTLLLAPSAWPAGDYELRVWGPGRRPGAPLERFALALGP